jgi:hypothetical protein
VPGAWGAKTASTPTDAMLRLWFPDGQPMNIGIGCKGSNLLVVDEDAPGELDRLCAELGTTLPDTYTVHTRKGRHFYFRDVERIMGNRTKVGGRAIDVRAGKADNYGGYVVAAGSFVLGEDGTTIEYLAQDSASEVAELPGWLRAWLTQTPDEGATVTPRLETTRGPAPTSGDRRFTDAQAKVYIEREVFDRLRRATPGGRNDALNAASVALGHFIAGGFGPEASARIRLRTLALEIGLGPEEVEATITSGFSYGMRTPYVRVAEATAPIPAITEVEPDRGDLGRFLLPRETWNATPELKHIYQAAMAQLTCPDAVLHATLAILASMLHHGTRVHTGKRPSVLSYYFAPVAPSGGGKSEALACARELLQDWTDDRFAIVGADGYVDGPVGSGEGLIEAFIDDVHEDIIDPETKQPSLDNNGNVKTRKVRKQARHNALFHTDEGRQVLAIDSRKGATVLAVLCEMWSGAVAGQTNADKDRSRKLAAGSYVVGMLLGFQAATIDPLFADEAGGAPQRFAFAPAVYPPHADDLDAEDEPWPGALELAVRSGPIQVHLGDEEKRAVRRHVRLQAAGRAQGGPLDGHRMLMQCRVAALLAILHADTVATDVERLDVPRQLWELAGTIVEHSCNVRDHLAATGVRRKEAAAQAADERMTRRQVQAARSVAEDVEARAAARVERVAAVLARRVLKVGEATGRALRDAVASRDKSVFEDALQHGVDRDWIIEREGHYRPGPRVGDIPGS